MGFKHAEHDIEYKYDQGCIFMQFTSFISYSYVSSWLPRPLNALCFGDGNPCCSHQQSPYPVPQH
jgi:hypothetical protein